MGGARPIGRGDVGWRVADGDGGEQGGVQVFQDGGGGAVATGNTPVVSRGRDKRGRVRLAWTLAFPQWVHCVGFENFLLQKLDKK